MKRIMLTGCLGQIGTELTLHLRDRYGSNNVLATDCSIKGPTEVMESGPFEVLDVLNADRMAELCDKYKINTIIHLAAILSAVGEENPQRAFNVNMIGLFYVLEVAREKKLQVFTPSSIAVFGKSTPQDMTPQDTIQRPNTIYGVTKVAGELLSDYYYTKFGVDTRGIRLPGIISHMAMPGGGTTDYAVHIFYEAVKNRCYTSFIAKGTKMDMIYMPDCLKAITLLLEADPTRLLHRNSFNIASMSCAPEDIATEIKKHIPDFELTYDVDPVRQAIAESWPNRMDDRCAREEWDWEPDYDLAATTKDMLERLSAKLNAG